MTLLVVERFKKEGKEVAVRASPLKTIFGDSALLVFLVCAFLFHFANAAMLPQLGEMLSHGSGTSAAPFMSACIIVTQVVIMCFAPAIGKFANLHGRKPLLMVGLRRPSPSVRCSTPRTHNAGGLIAIQILDGVANAIFAVVSILVVADRTRGTGRFNLAQGSLATAVGIGAALSNTFGGELIQHFSYCISFLSLGAIATLAFVLLWTAVPETLTKANPNKQDFNPRTSLPRSCQHEHSRLQTSIPTRLAPTLPV